MRTWLLLMACGDPRPLANDPPVLLELNGVPVLDPARPLELEKPELGEDLPIELLISDPEDDPVTVWFPGGPPGLDFDPWGTRGVWRFREPDTAWVTMELVLWDEHPDDPRWSSYAIHLD